MSQTCSHDQVKSQSVCVHLLIAFVVCSIKKLHEHANPPTEQLGMWIFDLTIGIWHNWGVRCSRLQTSLGDLGDIANTSPRSVITLLRAPPTDLHCPLPSYRCLSAERFLLEAANRGLNTRLCADLIVWDRFSGSAMQIKELGKVDFVFWMSCAVGSACFAHRCC